MPAWGSRLDSGPIFFVDEMVQHLPVLRTEVVLGLKVQDGGLYIDATVGAGGHAAEILHASSPSGQLLGLDADPEAIRYAQQVLRPFSDRVTLKVANFRYLGDHTMNTAFGQVDGVLMDLGVSSRQLADASRGLSFSEDGPLDMRFDQSQPHTAAELVNGLPEAELARLLWQLGEERHARRIAREIVAARPLTSTCQLADLVLRTVGHRERIHPATRTFQALRIAVNDELDALDEALPQGRDVLRPGGRMAVISFHSLEDRKVKRFFREEARDCICAPDAPICTCQHQAALRVVTRKPIRPTGQEIAENPRSRSAKLRLAERLASGTRPFA